MGDSFITNTDARDFARLSFYRLQTGAGSGVDKCAKWFCNCVPANVRMYSVNNLICFWIFLAKVGSLLSKFTVILLKQDSPGSVTVWRGSTKLNYSRRSCYAPPFVQVNQDSSETK